MRSRSSTRYRRHLLETCQRAPTSQRCRRAVLRAPKGTRVNGRLPRSGKLRKSQLMRNARGRIVSRRKSKRQKDAYDEGAYDEGVHPLRLWNEAARAVLDDVVAGRGYDEDFDASYVPY